MGAVNPPLPPAYAGLVRRTVRFAAISLVVGLLLGVASTEAQKRHRYAERPGVVEGDRRVALDLPPGLMWEATIDLRISHGHFVLLGAVVPLCFVGALALVHAAGGGVASPGVLRASEVLYVVGATGAMALVLYKGIHLVAHVRGGDFDLARAHATLFGGSRLLKGLAYGVSHTLLAAGAGLFAWALWRAAGPIGRGARADGAAPSAAGPGSTAPG